jgi:hypothetical protein
VGALILLLTACGADRTEQWTAERSGLFIDDVYKVIWYAEVSDAFARDVAGDERVDECASLELSSPSQGESRRQEFRHCNHKMGECASIMLAMPGLPIHRLALEVTEGCGSLAMGDH